MNEPSRNKLVPMLVLAAGLIIPVLLPQSVHGMYDPKHGRWLQRDPAGVRVDAPKGTLWPRQQYTDGLNIYEYVKGSPTAFLDSTGTMKTPCVDPMWGYDYFWPGNWSGWVNYGDLGFDAMGAGDYRFDGYGGYERFLLWQVIGQHSSLRYTSSSDWSRNHLQKSIMVRAQWGKMEQDLLTDAQNDICWGSCFKGVPDKPDSKCEACFTDTQAFTSGDNDFTYFDAGTAFLSVFSKCEIQKYCPHSVGCCGKKPGAWSIKCTTHRIVWDHWQWWKDFNWYADIGDAKSTAAGKSGPFPPKWWRP
ncbi:MAG: hypothetical protein QUV05_16980 [Phycisphaerae bacterium]|nr:hypothetical protein [Phycisphaerae bacterium]